MKVLEIIVVDFDLVVPPTHQIPAFVRYWKKYGRVMDQYICFL